MKGPWVGFEFHRCLHIQGCFATGGTITETPSNCIRLFDRRAEHITLTLGQTNPFKQHLDRWNIPCSFPINITDYSITWLHGWALLPLPCYGAKWAADKLCSMHCRARLSEQYNCDSIQVAINGATSRCQRACHQCLLNTLAFCVLEPSHRGAPLRLPPCHTCTWQRRGKHWDHSKDAGFSQQWYKGSYPTHSPALFAKRIVLVKRSEGGQLPRYGQQPPVVKGLQPAPIRRQDMRLDMAVFAW